MATFDKHQNFAIGRVLTIPSPAVSGTTLVLQSGEGTRFPDPATYGAYNATVFPTGIMPSPDNAEIVRITAKSSDTLTITRATESSTARTIQAGDTIIGSLTAKSLTDIEDFLTGTTGWPADIIPDTDDTYDIGSALKQWHDGFFGGDLTANGEKVVKPFVVVGMAEPVDYLCDGTDDDVQIQEAIDAVATDGGTVYLKEGTYNITSTINLGTVTGGISKVNLIGSGWGTILDVAVEDECIRVINSSDIVLKDFAVDCNEYYSTSGLHPILMQVCSTVLVEHLYVHDTQVATNNYAAAMSGDRLINTTIKDCLLKMVRDYAINIQAALRCKIINNFIWNAGHGINISHGAYGDGDYERSKNNVISGNSVYADSDGSAFTSNGIKLTKADYTTVNNNVLYRTAVSSSCSGIHTVDYDDDSDSVTNNTNYVSHNVYSNNTIINYQFGIRLAANNDSVVSGNTILVGDTTTNGGIWVGQSTALANTTPVDSIRLTITGNIIAFNTTQATHTGVGIRIQTLTTHCNIIGNSIYYASNIGLTLDYQSNYNMVIGNTIKDSYAHGLICGYDDPSANKGASYNVISGNIVRGSSRVTDNTYSDIVSYNNSTYNTITGNQCIANGTNKSSYGVREQPSSDYNTIIGNTLVGQLTGGVLIVGANTEIGHNIGY